MNIEKDDSLYDGGGRLKLNRLTLNSKGKTFIRDYIPSDNAVCSVVYNKITNKYIFVRQFRPGPKREILEVVAGMCDEKGENPIDTMKREILEEIGYKIDTIVKILEPFYTSCGKTNEMIYTFFSVVSEQENKGGGLETENEDIEIVELTKQQIKTTKFVDAKTIIALQKLNLL